MQPAWNDGDQCDQKKNRQMSIKVATKNDFTRNNRF